MTGQGLSNGDPPSVTAYAVTAPPPGGAKQDRGRSSGLRSEDAGLSPRLAIGKDKNAWLFEWFLR